MRKEEFLAELGELLSDLSEVERREALEFYRDYLDDIGDDVDALEAVGTPEKVAQRVKAGLAGNPEEEIEYTDRGYRDQFDDQETAYMTPRGRRREQKEPEGEEKGPRKQPQTDEAAEKRNQIGRWILVAAVLMMVSGTFRKVGLLAILIGGLLFLLGSKKVQLGDSLRRILKIVLIVLCVIACVGFAARLSQFVLRSIGISRGSSPASREITGDFSKIQITADAGVIIVEEADVTEVKVSGSKDECRKSGDTLVIEAGDSFFSLNREIRVQIPAGTELEQVTAEVNAGEIRIQGLQTGEFHGVVNAGNLAAQDLTVLTKAEVEINAGTAEVKLTGEYEDYNYQVDVNLGNVIINGNSYAGLGEEQLVDHEASKNVVLECNAGSLKIEIEH